MSEIKELLLPQEANWVIVHGKTKKNTPYTYTVGLMNSKQVEIVIAGLEELEAEKYLNFMAYRIQAHEGRISDFFNLYEFKLENGKDDYDSRNFILRDVEPRRARTSIFLRAARYEVTSGMRARYLQMFYPDLKGLHPWNSGCAHEVVDAQYLNLPICPSYDPDR